MRQHKRIFCDCELTHTLLGLVWMVLWCINGLFSHYKYSYLSLVRLKKGNQVLLICCLSCATSTNNIDPDQVASEPSDLGLLCLPLTLTNKQTVSDAVTLLVSVVRAGTINRNFG